MHIHAMQTFILRIGLMVETVRHPVPPVPGGRFETTVYIDGEPDWIEIYHDTAEEADAAHAEMVRYYSTVDPSVYKDS